MASRLTEQRRDRLRELRRKFNAGVRAVPCIYCSLPWSRPVEVVPEYLDANKRVRKAHVADLCWPCMRRLKLSRADRAYATAAVKYQKDTRAMRREDARDYARANQQSLFNTEDGPEDAIAGG